MPFDLRHEALLMLDKRGGVLETAKAVSEVLRQRNVRGAVIGGVAVVLHGHVRTSRGVDVLVQQPLDDMKAALEQAGATFDADRREFLLHDVPVQLVPESMVTPAPKQYVDLEQIQTISLADLISIKLHSGTRDPLLRAQDLADVIGLIRHHGLTNAFAPKINRRVRGEFKKLVKAVG